MRRSPGLRVILTGVISVRSERGEELLALDDFEARVRRGQIAPTTPVRFPILTGERWVDARELELFRRLYAPARIHFSRAFTLGRFPWLTAGLVLAQFAWFFLVAGLGGVLSADALIAAGAKTPANVLELGETWRLISANLVHRDVLHLAFNMFFLFNVGGTIENAYRRRDYVLILVVSGLATTLLSMLMSPLPSAGASGVVLGLFGAASVFGYKYAEILPGRYRRYLTGAVLPYALFVLYVGLATPHTDNWGHLGGLLGGVLVALPLSPQLLVEGHGLRTRFAAPVTALALALVVLAAGPILRSMPPSLSVLSDDTSGLEVAYPRPWRFGQNHLGYPAFGNVLGANIGMRARRDPEHPFSLSGLERSFLEDLARLERDGDVSEVRLGEVRPVTLAGGRALERRVSVSTRAGVLETRNLLIERGQYGYVVSLSAPSAFAADYERVFEAMLSRLKLIEPARVARARREADTFPGMSSAHIELGEALASIGAPVEAAAAYRRALTALPDHPDALFGLAHLALHHGGDLEEASELAERLWTAKAEDPSVAALVADLCVALGQTERARAVLEATLDRAPDATPLRERLLRLRAGDTPGGAAER